MSAPDTNIEKQAKNHKAPLVGIAGGLAFVGILLAALVTYLVANGTPPQGADEQVDGRTGAMVEAE